MDRIDNAILDQLEVDGRLTNAELAERVRLSPSACLRRVRALEAAGVIAGYHAVVDPAARDRGFQVLVYTTLMLRNRETIAAFEAAVVELDEVVECHRMFGDPDYVIRVAVAEHAVALDDRVELRDGGLEGGDRLAVAQQQRRVDEDLEAAVACVGVDHGVIPGDHA